MNTNPKDRSLSNRKEAIGKMPWPNLPRPVLNLLASQQDLMKNISYPGAIKSWRGPPRRCNINGKSKRPQFSDTITVNWCGSIQSQPRFVNIFFRERFPWPYWRRWSPPQIIDTTWSHYVGYSQDALVVRGTNPSWYYVLDPVQRCYGGLPPWDVNIPFRFVVLSTPIFQDPFDWKSIVLVLTGNSKPAFAVHRRQGDEVWVTQDSAIRDPHDPEKQLMKFTSAIAFEGKFYVISLQGTLAVMEDINSQLTITKISTSRAVPSVRAKHFRECLLEANGEILLIFLISQKTISTVDKVEVFLLNLPKLVWVKMENLGNRTFFVERECCLWVTASKVGCKSNCVYFNQGSADGWWMYDLESGNISSVWINSDFTVQVQRRMNY